MPSLNQLAARMNNGAPASASALQSGSSRPRLAASILRTGSTNSVATTASTADSTAVQAPSTRSTSPAAISISPPQSTTPTIPEHDVTPSEPLTSETLEKLNQETTTLPKKTKVGYKNIPSLDAITARLVKARSLSIDGSAKPPEAELIEDPKTPGIAIKAPEHPLQYPWCVRI